MDGAKENIRRLLQNAVSDLTVTLDSKGQGERETLTAFDDTVNDLHFKYNNMKEESKNIHEYVIQHDDPCKIVICILNK